MQVAQVATEITGGSDIGASRTEARQENGRWLLNGEKWFASNVGADLIVTLARVDPDIPGTQGWRCSSSHASARTGAATASRSGG